MTQRINLLQTLSMGLNVSQMAKVINSQLNEKLLMHFSQTGSKI